MTTKFTRGIVAAAIASSMFVAPGFVATADAAPMPAATVAKPGSTGATVRTVQYDLQYLRYYTAGVDGKYGSITATSVRAFQKANKLPVTGIVDTATYNKLRAVSDAKRAADRKAAAAKKATNKVVAKPGDKNNTVKQIQGRLNGLGYLPVSSIIGVYGPATTAAVKSFQKNSKLPVTGVVDTTTSKLLITKYANRSKAPKPAKPAKPFTNKVVAKPGDRNNTVKQIQGRLNGLGYLPVSSIIGVYGPATTAAVKSFQKNSKLPVTGVVDTTTSKLLITKYANRPKKVKPAMKLDSRCFTGRTICINKSTQRMYWVVNGSIKRSWSVRTGRSSLPTRSGNFKVYLKHPNWYSTLYHVNMPYTQFFSGGQAVHFSSEFARIGHSGSGSHGCVNMNSLSEARWLYNQTRVGDKVIVY